LPKPETPLTSASETAEHLLSAEEKFGKNRIEFQHLGFVQVFQAARLFAVKPAVHNFTRHEFVFDLAKGTVVAVFTEEHLGRNIEFVHIETSN
jgi:Fe2+ or Zn2+ uptake regulation protein